MEPVILATVTAAITVLATECAKGLAGQAGKDAWGKIKSLFGWSKDPNPADLSTQIAARLAEDRALAPAVLEILRTGAGAGTATQLVQHLKATKSIIALTIN